MKMSNKVATYVGVGVMRDILPLARVFYDITVYDDGFSGFAMWQRNTYRIPIISQFKDFMKRRKWAAKGRDKVVADDERNFFFTFDSVQGIVTHDKHKELQILTNSEQFNIIFRSPGNYENFVGHLKSKIDNKVFDRDRVEIKSSVYIS